MLKEYLSQNWPLILILAAFTISLISTVFMEKKRVVRLHAINASIFVLSIIVFIEFSIAKNPDYRHVRAVLTAIRYSATPFIIALITFALVKKQNWLIFIPAMVLAVLDFVSIPTGIIFLIDETNSLVRTPVMGYLPYIVSGLYGAFLIYILIARSNKRFFEIISIVFMALAIGSGLILPFIFGSDYSSMFCVTIAIALFAYYELTVLQLTKKDSLTELLNRHAYYADLNNYNDDITAIVSIDMNGLKCINDNYGHAAGDEALVTLALCFSRSLRRRQYGYRVGGDEFMIICNKNSEEEVLALVDRIRKYVSETKYSCSVGYSYRSNKEKTVDDLVKESDVMMYQEKGLYYQQSGIDRRIL